MLRQFAVAQLPRPGEEEPESGRLDRDPFYVPAVVERPGPDFDILDPYAPGERDGDTCKANLGDRGYGGDDVLEGGCDLEADVERHAADHCRDEEDQPDDG